jgi:hypothetical protein
MAINFLSNLANDDYTIAKQSSFPKTPMSGRSFIDSVSDNSLPPIVDIISRQVSDNNENQRIVTRPDSSVTTNINENETVIELAKGANQQITGRLKNPLSYLATYTYQLSLYLVSPAAYEAFIASGRRNIEIFNQADFGGNDSGAYLIAQSGGKGASSIRAPGMKYDYFIDKLSMDTIMPAQSSSPTNVSINFKFTIVEPYGFSFVSELARAQLAIRKNQAGSLDSSGPKSENLQDTTKNFFILGIRFFGWDENGKQMKGNEIMPDGKPLDPNASGNGALFETFTELIFSSFKFRVDGRSTIYNIEAQPTAVGGAINVRKGMVRVSRDIYGTTVGDMLTGPDGLLTQLNKEQKELEKAGTVGKAITYKIEWVPDDEIKNASIITDNIKDKTTQPGTDIKNTKESNDAAALSGKPNKNKRKMTVAEIPIVQAIEQVISNSTYIMDALTKNYIDNKEIDSDTNTPPSLEGKGKELKWFTINPKLTNITWDDKRNDWVYDITYVIKPYLIPNIPAPYVNKTTEYYGPHKRYDYWYTGQNTEILAYEQVINTNYFLATLSEDRLKEVDDSKVRTFSVSPDTEPEGDKSNSRGTVASASVNAFKTSLYDPASFAEAKFQILGDPDLLFNSSVSTSVGTLDESGKIDATSRQIFIEVDFKEARDYNVSKETISDLTKDGTGITGQPGTMALNNSIEFWKYDSEKAREKIKGVSYLLVRVKSNFSNGAFTQHITAVINPMIASDAIDKETQEQLNEEKKDIYKETIDNAMELASKILIPKGSTKITDETP